MARTFKQLNRRIFLHQAFLVTIVRWVKVYIWALESRMCIAVWCIVLEPDGKDEPQHFLSRGRNGWLGRKACPKKTVQPCEILKVSTYQVQRLYIRRHMFPVERRCIYTLCIFSINFKFFNMSKRILIIWNYVFIYSLILWFKHFKFLQHAFFNSTYIKVTYIL